MYAESHPSPQLSYFVTVRHSSVGLGVDVGPAVGRLAGSDSHAHPKRSEEEEEGGKGVKKC